MYHKRLKKEFESLIYLEAIKNSKEIFDGLKGYDTILYLKVLKTLNKSLKNSDIKL